MTAHEHGEKKRPADQCRDDADRNLDRRDDRSSDRVARHEERTPRHHRKGAERAMAWTEEKSSDVWNDEANKPDWPARGDNATDHE